MVHHFACWLSKSVHQDAKCTTSDTGCDKHWSADTGNKTSPHTVAYLSHRELIKLISD